MRKCNGLTLAELVMAMSITSIIGLTVAGASMGLSSAHNQGEDQYDSLATARSAMRQVQRSLQKAQLITTVYGDSRVVYWAGDANGDGQINLSELRLMRYGSWDGEIREYSLVFPEEWSQAVRDSSDLQVSLAWAMYYPNVENSLVGGSYTRTRTIATGVTGFWISTSSNPPMSTFVNVKVAVGEINTATMLTGAVSMRADLTRFVGISENQYVLSIPSILVGAH